MSRTNQDLDNKTVEELKSEIRYRVEQEYQKYHNDLTFELNGKDFWIEQIVWKLSDTLSAHYLQLILDVIGEDKPLRPYPKGAITTISTDIENAYATHRNDYKAELRKQFTELLSKEK